MSLTGIGDSQNSLFMRTTWVTGLTSRTSIRDSDSLGLGWGKDSRGPRWSYSWMFRKYQKSLAAVRLYLDMRMGWGWEGERRMCDQVIAATIWETSISLHYARSLPAPKVAFLHVPPHHRTPPQISQNLWWEGLVGSAYSQRWLQTPYQCSKKIVLKSWRDAIVNIFVYRIFYSIVCSFVWIRHSVC